MTHEDRISILCIIVYCNVPERRLTFKNFVTLFYVDWCYICRKFHSLSTVELLLKCNIHKVSEKTYRRVKELNVTINGTLLCHHMLQTPKSGHVYPSLYELRYTTAIMLTDQTDACLSKDGRHVIRWYRTNRPLIEPNRILIEYSVQHQ